MPFQLWTAVYLLSSSVCLSCARPRRDSALQSFGRDLTADARNDLLDPVIGRHDVIQRALQVSLGRRADRRMHGRTIWSDAQTDRWPNTSDYLRVSCTAHPALNDAFARAARCLWHLLWSRLAFLSACISVNAQPWVELVRWGGGGQTSPQRLIWVPEP
jgi:hypothetical protein